MGLWTPLWQAESSSAASVGATDDLPSLSPLGSLIDSTYLNGARAICTADGFLYVGAWDSDRFTILDGTSTSPVFVSSLKLPGGAADGDEKVLGARGVAVCGDVVALVCSLSNQLFLISVRDKDHPVVIGTLTDAKLAGAHRVTFDGRYSYVSSLDWFLVVDCAQAVATGTEGVPVAPTIKGSCDFTGADCYGFTIKGDIAYVAESARDRYTSVDLRDKANPTKISSVLLAQGRVVTDGVVTNLSTTLDSATANFVAADAGAPIQGTGIPPNTTIAAVVSSTRVTLSNPATSTGSGRTITIVGGGPHSIVIDGPYGYSANSGANSVHIFDVSDPAAMTIVGHVEDTSLLNGAHTLEKLGKYVLVCVQSQSGFAVVDISAPTAPIIVGSYFDNDTMNGVRSMAVAGPKVYGAAFTSDAVVTLDLHGLLVSTARIGSFRADIGSVRGEFSAGSMKVHDGFDIGPGGLRSAGPGAFPALQVGGLDAATKAYVDAQITAIKGTATAAADTLGEVEALLAKTGLIARTSYVPAVSVLYTTTSSTFTDVDATNLVLPFTVPANGKILIRLEGWAFITGATAMAWNLREGSSDLASSERIVSVSTVATRVSTTILRTGLTPGASLTYKWGYASADNTNNARIRAGAVAFPSITAVGPAVMEAWAVNV